MSQVEQKFKDYIVRLEKNRATSQRDPDAKFRRAALAGLAESSKAPAFVSQIDPNHPDEKFRRAALTGLAETVVSPFMGGATVEGRRMSALANADVDLVRHARRWLPDRIHGTAKLNGVYVPDSVAGDPALNAIRLQGHEPAPVMTQIRNGLATFRNR